jgi:hypothetical protein
MRIGWRYVEITCARSADPAIELTPPGSQRANGGQRAAAACPAPRPLPAPGSGWVLLDEAERFPHNRIISVAALRTRFAFAGILEAFG